MTLRVTSLAVVAVLSALVAGCTASPGAAPTGQSAAATSAAAEPSPSASTTPDPSASASPSPEPSSSPTSEPVVLAGEDLLPGLPTNKQMSKIQGFRFNEETNWDYGGNAGPQWVRSAPLTKKQRSQILLGSVRKVKPESCSVVATWVDFYGVPSELSGREYIRAAAYSKRDNNYDYYKRSKVGTWQTTAYVLPPGQAQLIVDDVSATRDKCLKYTVVSRDGDIERVNVTKMLPRGKSAFRSGDAYIQKHRIFGAAGPVTWLTVAEAIGDIYYVTTWSAASNERPLLSRASQVYNVLADNLAEVAQVSRQPVDFNDLEKYTADPGLYAPLTPPIASGATV